MRVNDTLQALLDAGDWFGLAGYFWSDAAEIPYAQPFLIGLGVFVVLLLLFGMFGPRPEQVVPGAKELPPVSTKAVKPRGTVYIPLRLGNVTVDLQPTMTETLHTVIGGATRTGKSTSVLPLFDLPIGVLCIALDITVPIEAKVRSVGGTVWTNDPDECSIGLDVLGGSSRIASEGLVAGFPKAAGNIGDYQRSARSVIWAAMDAMDAQGVRRGLPEIILALLTPMPDAEAGRACRSWARKLSALYQIIGPTLGYDLDVVEAMRRGEKVLLRLNRFLSPDDAPFLAGMLLVLARRVMEQAGVPFVLIVEEAGQAQLAQEHLSPIAQAGAARGAPMIVLTQNISTMPLEVRNNLSITVSFAQEDAAEQRKAAERLDLDPEQLKRKAFPDKGVGWCYVRAPGIETTLVHIKQQKPSKPGLPKALPGQSIRTVEYPRLIKALSAPAVVIEAEPQAEREEVPEWIGYDRDLLRMWAKCERMNRPVPLWSPERGLWWDERGCLVWTDEKAMTSGKWPRPRSTIRGRDITPYIEFWAAFWGGRRPVATLDHLCDRPTCCEPEHLEDVSIAENNARRVPRREAFRLAYAAA